MGAFIIIKASRSVFLCLGEITRNVPIIPFFAYGLSDQI